MVWTFNSKGTHRYAKESGYKIKVLYDFQIRKATKCANAKCHYNHRVYLAKEAHHFSDICNSSPYPHRDEL